MPSLRPARPTVTASRPGVGSPFVSVGTKLTGAMLVVLGIVTLFAYFEVNRNEREQVLASKARAATMVTEIFAAGVTAPLSFGDTPGVREHVAFLTANSNVVYGGVWGADPGERRTVGEKLGDTARSGYVPRSPPVIPAKVEVERAPDLVLVTQPVVGAAGEVLGVVLVAFSLQQENAAIQAAQRRTLITSLALGLGLGVVLLALTRTLIVRRLARLAGAAKRLEEGEAVDIDVDTNDEVGRLSRAFASMTEAIETREARISARNRDLRRVLDNVAEGLLTVQKDGRMSDERSRVLDEWFGPPDDPHQFFEYFERFSPATARWLRLGWTALADDCVPVEAVLDQMPRRFEYRARSFELDYLPIWDGPEADQILDEVLVVVRDITSQMDRERAEQAQREAMNVFRRILDDREGLRQFFREASRLVRVIATSTAAPVEASRILRDIHTLKGNTALYGIESVAELCHRIESRIHEEGGGPTGKETAELEGTWEKAQGLFDELDRSSEERIELRMEEYEEHVTQMEAWLPRHELTAAVRTWAHELAGHRLQRIADHGSTLARRLGKSDTTIEIVVSPPNLRLPTRRWSGFWAAFAHILRNTLDHGIEPAWERKAAGKSPGGKVQISVTSSKSGIELVVIDDGRGIRWEKVRERARDLGLPHETTADLEEALYADRVTTHSTATQISGRGVGMGAIRDAVQACDGRIAIETTSGRGTTLRFHFPLSMLESHRRTLSPSLVA
jgi:two-component system chemotaxis sensor kinase CheA